MVAELLEFKLKLDAVLFDCFENNRSLTDTVQDAFKYFINVRKNRPAELIAKYVDHLMKSGNKGNCSLFKNLNVEFVSRKGIEW